MRVLIEGRGCTIERKVADVSVVTERQGLTFFMTSDEGTFLVCATSRLILAEPLPES